MERSNYIQDLKNANWSSIEDAEDTGSPKSKRRNRRRNPKNSREYSDYSQEYPQNNFRYDRSASGRSDLQYEGILD